MTDEERSKQIAEALAVLNGLHSETMKVLIDRDLAIHGQSFFRVTADGSVERLNPMDVYYRDQSDD